MATNVNIGGDTTGLDVALQKAQNSVGKATAGMGRGIATAVGASLGPFGELIEKADAFAASVRGASGATRLMAGVVGLAMSAAAFAVIKAKEAYDSMRQAQDEANEATNRAIASQNRYAESVIKSGVARSQEAKATKILLDEIADAQAKLAQKASFSVYNPFTDNTTFFGGLSPQEQQDQLKRIENAQKALDRIRSGQAAAANEQDAFNSRLGTDASRAMDEERRKQFSETFDAQGLQRLKEQRKILVEARQNVAANEGGAITANVITSQVDELDKLTKLIEDRLNANRGQTRFAELASIGGAAALPGIASRQDATKDIPRKIDTTNGLLREIKEQRLLLN